MIAEIEPWLKYPDVMQQRLAILANLIRKVRSDCVALYQPEYGDTDWSLGCRAYERTFFAFRELSKTTPWLTILSELKALQFSFAIGSVPMRYYKGDPADPPTRYLAQTNGEHNHIQTCFEFEGVPTVDTILRLAAEVDATREVFSVSFVEIDEYKEVIGQYRIPFDGHALIITPMQTPPVSMPPAIAEPLKKEVNAEEVKEKKIHAAG